MHRSFWLLMSLVFSTSAIAADDSRLLTAEKMWALKRLGDPSITPDGATAVVLAELEFEPEQGRGLFVLSRSVGILSHAYEQTRQGGRIKGPMPPSIPYCYDGPSPRTLPADRLSESKIGGKS
jgi:citrate synthase